MKNIFKSKWTLVFFVAFCTYNSYSKCVPIEFKNIKDKLSLIIKAKVLKSNYNDRYSKIGFDTSKENRTAIFWMNVEVLKVYKGKIKNKNIRFEYLWKWYMKPGSQVFKKGDVLILSMRDLPENGNSK